MAVRALVEAGVDVRATDQRMMAGLPVPIEVASLLDRFTVYALVRDCDLVVHLGNYPSMNTRVPEQQLYSENVTMNANVFIAAAESGVRQIVFASSVQAFAAAASRAGADGADTASARPGRVPYLPLDSDLPRRGRNVYGLSKVVGEQLLEHLCDVHRGLAGVAIRFPALHERERLRQWHRRKAAMQETGAEVPDHWIDEGFSYLMLEDAASLLVAVAQHPQRGYQQMFPAAAGNVLACGAAELVQRYYPDVPVRRDINGSRSLVDISSITERIGWTPRYTVEM